ncbi:MAG: hypothetical protein J6A59_00235 [Lachnospiraceae bacterium]|nr:hypothetical protein [Lachnospiraceae bacterium]
MEVKDIADMLKKNLNNVLTPSGYKRILNKRNNLTRFDILNRILIDIQCKDAFELKTYDEWVIDGRIVRDKAKPIYILIPKYKTVYVEADTDKEIGDTDLNSNELLKAIEYGIIKRVDTFDNMYVEKVYDIRQTKSLNNTKYDVNKPVVNTRAILELLEDIVGCTMELCDDTYYSKSDNILYIKKTEYSELVKLSSDIIADYYIRNEIKNIIDEHVDSDDTLSEYDIELIKNSIKYGINTLFACDDYVSFDIINHTNTTKIMYILNIVDSIMFNISARIKFTRLNNSVDIASNINLLKKAEAILDIMEANNINKIMKGA